MALPANSSWKFKRLGALPNTMATDPANQDETAPAATSSQAAMDDPPASQLVSPKSPRKPNGHLLDLPKHLLPEIAARLTTMPQGPYCRRTAEARHRHQTEHRPGRALKAANFTLASATSQNNRRGRLDTLDNPGPGQPKVVRDPPKDLATGPDPSLVGVVTSDASPQTQEATAPHHPKV